MVARRPTILATMAESPFEAPDTPKFTLHALALDSESGYNKNEPGHEDRADRTPDSYPVYVSTPSDTETAAHLKGTLEGDGFMPRGGSEQPRPGSSRRQSSHSSQQRRYPPPNPPPPDSPQNYNAPVYVTPQYTSPHPGYGGQYMMSPQPPLNLAHSPTPQFPYPPTSIHAGFPTIVSYTQQYPPDAQPYAPQTPPNPAYRYTSPMSPASYSGYQRAGQFPSQPAMYPPHGVYPSTTPYSSYPSPPGHQHPSSPQQEDQSGTWWFVPSPPPQQPQQQQSQYEMGGQQQNPNPASYFYGAPAPPSPQPPPDSPAQQHTSYPASPTYARALTASSSASSPPPAAPKPLVRRAYHPNPPAHRSEWVMWAGNVPSDAGHDELWRFFTAPPPPPASEGGSGPASSASSESSSVEAATTGVLSIFLISRSSCAFINYDTEAALEAAIARFNGVPLRPADPRCARLVCRVRRRDDDLRAGVGGQRGMGMHTKHVRDKAAAAAAAATEKGKGREWDRRSGTDEESSESAASQLSALSLSSEEEPTRPPPRPYTQGSASSGSHASVSTNSSLLTRHFPRRFFILKSLTRDDLDLSARKGVWATQRHNEGVLDQAFRTAKDVFLIFSVNKSGEFYGYARMAGPVGQEKGGTGGGSHVTWAVRSPPVSPLGSSSPSTRRDLPVATASYPALHGDSTAVHHLPPHEQPPPTTSPLLSSAARLVDESPAPISGLSSATQPARPQPHSQSAPAVLGKPPRAFSGVDRGPSHSLDAYRPQIAETDLQLDEAAPFRAVRNPEGESELGRVPEEPEVLPAASGAGAGTQEESWGQNFALQWLCTERLPFTRTRHIRNPWNHDREVKVSRDGTELEPGVGQALLEEWQAYLAESEAQAQAGQD